jgi:hypothetical protein
MGKENVPPIGKGKKVPWPVLEAEGVLQERKCDSMLLEPGK